jgi:hypothetical protein
MPKSDNKSMNMNSKSAWPNGLRFVASLFFLYVLFGGTSAGSGWWSAWVTSGAGALWLPILFGAAVLSSIALFFSSLAGLVFKTSMGMMSGKTQTIAAFALIALTVSLTWSSVFWIVVVGFILGWVGNALEMM